MTLAVTRTMRKETGKRRRKECDRRSKSNVREIEKDETYEGDDRLRSTRSVNNTKADCGRG